MSILFFKDHVLSLHGIQGNKKKRYMKLCQQQHGKEKNESPNP